ncbi:MAG: C1 family peptidase, partial [Bacteroidales bacterium]|nr:C1 family peptidase [Bacteroidales bacterium]
MKSQTIQIDSTFTTDAEIFPFEPGDTIYGLSISGTVQLFSDTSLVRVILSDLNGNEWMVYEAYPMIYPNKNCNLINFADETKYLFVTHPTKLYISLIEATLFLDSIHPDYNPHEDLSMLQNQHKDIIETNKEDSITFSIANHSMLWFANRNGMSDKSYQEKKILFGEKYNLMGLDYYGGGLFDGIPGVTGSKDESELVEEFDWRNRHGANNPVKTNFYYDGDPTGSGWLTSIKDQSPYECNGTCYIHGPLGAIEGVSNLYYNQHIDYELSVQHILDCDDEFYWPNWPDCKGNPGGTHQFIREIGVMDDDAYNRDPIELECRSDQPPDGQPDYWIKIHDFHGLINFTTEVLKESLIHFGPMEVVIHNFQFGPHSMALVGYGTLKIGYTFHNPLNTTEIRTVVADSEYEGHLFWKLKNSWGPGWGDLGYFYYLAEETEITQPIYYELPIINILPGQDEMLAFDKDKDGYWNWGISESHDLPEGVCSELKDSDDSENRIGPFDQFYYGTPILPDMKVYLLSNVLPEYIDHQSFLSFSSNDLIQGKLQFFIENPGNAQLNLRPWGFVGERPVEIIEVDGSSPNYSISDTDQPQIKVCMGTANGFHITFTGTQQGELTKVRIYLDENDEIPDFEFILVYNDCQTSNVIQELTGNNYWSSFALKPDNYL